MLGVWYLTLTKKQLRLYDEEHRGYLIIAKRLKLSPQ